MAVEGSSVRVLAGDTWGIPGPQFVNLVVTCWIALIVLFWLSSKITGPRRYPAGTQLIPDELGYLVGGPPRAVQAAAAEALAAGVLRRVGPRLVATRPVRTTTRLQWECARWLANPDRRKTILHDRAVKAALAETRRRLGDRGLWYSAAAFAIRRTLAWLMAALAVISVVRIVAGLANDKPVMNLVTATGLFGLIALAVTGTSGRLPRVSRQIARVGAGKSGPVLRPLGAAAAVGVAFAGGSTLAQLDPVLFQAMGPVATDNRWSSGSTSTGDGGGGDGGGGGCGGGCGG